MNQPVFPILWALGGLIIGALISWVLAKSRQREALAAAEANSLQAATTLQIELSSVREKASRAQELERELTTVQHALNGANERRAALESELSRLPELEARRWSSFRAVDEGARNRILWTANAVLSLSGASI